MKPLVSILIPVYNGEKYLEECLDSIVHQAVQNWECIIVNDGSTDSSLSIIEKYANQDTRFSFVTIPNSGSAKMPIDTAVTLAKSDWIVVVGQDDFLDTDTVEKLLVRANETKADIVYLRMNYFCDDNFGIYFLPVKDFNMQQIMTGKEAVMYTIPEWKIGANGALIKRKIYEQLSTFRGEIHLMNTDEYDTRELMLHANIIAFADTHYFYRMHPESITRKFSIKWFDDLITDKMLEDLIKQHFANDGDQVKAIQEKRMGNIRERLYFLYKFGKSLSQEQRKKARKIIKEHYKNINKQYVYEHNKLKRILLAKNYNLFQMTLYLHYLLKKIKVR
jgi:glycosyltransferase involved in cell wall biosynthesis